MARQLADTRQRAFTWTGPYGGGKSSLALTLCSLVGPNAKLREKARQILALPADSAVAKAFSSRGDGWLVLPVVGRRASVISDLRQALARAKGEEVGKRKASDVIAELVEAAESHKQGVLIVIDELGKFLEASAHGGDDVYFFQELAEAASRTSGKLVVVGILHQPFDAYAARLGRQAQDDWAKVQGRFVDIPLVAATDEVIELIGRAIQVDDEAIRQSASGFADTIATAIRARRPGAPAGLAGGLLRCWPVHPVTAALLGPISKRRFGQNERSTFGFLASREPLGFVEFLDGQPNRWESMYGPAQYWDYLRANLEPAILASPDSHRWAVACDAVDRAEAGGSAVHIDLVKAVALIEMFRNGTGLVPEESVLTVSIQGADPQEIHAALQDLVHRKILIERKHLGAYGVFAGSDFDIEGAMIQARAEIGAPPLEQVAALSDLQPILAKRLYHETGTMRWFTRRIVSLANVEDAVDRFGTGKGAVGCFWLCLPEIGQSERSADNRAQKLSGAMGNRSVILGVPSNAERITELSLELAAAHRILNTRPELEGDAVARRELIGRMESVRATLEEELADAFSLSKWYRQGQLQNRERGMSLSVIASSIAQDVFPKTPNILSELINREEPSSNSVRARKDLLYRMVSHPDRENLGYDGYPADAGLYYSLLQAPGLHAPREDGRWGFGPPNANARGASMETLWWATQVRLTESGSKLTLAEIYAFWAAPPYGLRAGVMPVLALALFMACRSSVAMYVDGVFTPDLSEAVVDEWLLDPRSIRFQFVEASQDEAMIVQAIAESVGQTSIAREAAGPLDAARALVGMVVDLPEWTKRTTSISSSSQEVRGMLLRAHDPHKVLFTDLPSVLQVSAPAELIAKLRTVTDELSASYGEMLGSVSRALFAALDHEGRSLESLHLRATTVKGITGDFRLDAFAGRLELFDGSQTAIEGLISLAVSKPSNNWVDRDIDAAILQLSSWAIEFRRAEAMATLRGRPSTRRIIGVVFGASHGNDVTASVDVSESDVPAVDDLVKRVLATVCQEKPEIILAALAEAGALLMKQSKKEAA
ncbi:ATP-binding protein [Burkholderia gladioli]|uniref:ATP-binding protein n=1 Tax=Burkholderia gladioli TaxID=28095 RepID=UPI001EDD21E9|nr:ATP-binding protein [Burkholderia gladioli]